MSEDTVWLDVLPNMSGFGPALVKGADKDADKAGKSVGKKFGLAAAAGVTAVAGGVVLAGKALYNLGSTFDDMTDTIRVGTGATGEALDGLVASAKNVATTVPADFESISTAVADINTRMGLTGDTLETFAGQVLEAGRLTGEAIDVNKVSAAFSVFGVEGEAATGAMDTLYRVSQDTGVGMNELASIVQKAGPAVQALGFDFDQTAALVGGLDKAGLDASKMTAGLGRALVELSKDGEDPAKTFERVTGEIQAMAEAGDTAGAVDMASKLFGTKNAPQFVQALQEGKLNIEDLTAAATGSGDTIMQASADTADFAEQWVLFKNRMSLLVAPVAEKVFGLIGDGMKWINDVAIPYLENFFAGWSAGEGPLTNVGNIFDLLASFVRDTLWPIFQNLMTYISTTVIPYWQQVAGVIADTVVPVLRDMWAIFKENVLPILRDVADIVTEVVLPILASLVEFLAGTFTGAINALSPLVRTVFDFISSTIRNAMNFVQGLIKTVLAVIRGDWSGAWDGIKRIASALWDQIKNVISTAIELVRTIIGGVLDKITKAWSDAWDGIKRIASALWDQIKNVISGAIEGVRSGIATALGKITTAWSDAWDGIKRIASDLWGKISKGIGGAIEGVRTGIDTTLGKIATTWSTAWGGLKTVGQAAWDWIKTTASGVFETLRGSVEGSFRNMKTAVETIWNGIKGVVARPINAVIGFINKGVIGAYNWVAGKIGLKELGTIALLPGYKSGGYTGRVDPNQIAGVTHGNEYVLTSRETDALGGPSGVEAWKALALGRGYKTGGAVRPVPGGHFGWNGGRYKSGKWHGGLDFGGSLGSPAGTAIRAMWAGVVTKALRLNRSYGHHAVLDHGGGLSTLYAHMSRLGVNVGQRVGAGEVIGRVGNTGNSQGAHLHLEVRRGGKQTNPEPYLSGAATLRNVGAAVADGFDGVVDWFKGLTDKFGGIWNKAPKGGGLFGDLASGVAKKLVDELKVWAKDKLNPIGGYAAGTASAAPGWAWVGERGPELVRFRGGEQVLPAPQSARMAAGGISVGQVIVDFASIDELPKLISWLEGLRRMQRMGVVS